MKERSRYIAMIFVGFHCLHDFHVFLLGDDETPFVLLFLEKMCVLFVAIAFVVCEVTLVPSNVDMVW